MLSKVLQDIKNIQNLLNINEETTKNVVKFLHNECSMKIFTYEFRKILSKLLITYIDKEFFDDTNNFIDWIFDGEVFKKYFGHIEFKKLLNRYTLKYKEYQYELEYLNVLNQEIDYNDESSGKELCFSQKKDILYKFEYNVFMCTVSVPAKSNVYVLINENEVRSTELYLGNWWNFKITIDSEDDLENFNKIKKRENIYELHLRHVYLKTLPTKIFECINIQSLDIYYYDMRKIPDEIINLKYLKYLSITDCGIKIFSKKIFELNKLKSLDLDNNNIDEIPDGICNLTELEHLDLNNNGIKNFSEEICKLTKLKRLSMKYNKIKKIPHQIENLINLKSLDLNNNEIEFFPKEICNLEKLEYLNLHHNKISEIPYTIGNLLSLLDINLSFNEIKNIPNTIGKLKNLGWLHLNNNKIKIIPNEIGNLQNLTSLDLHKNEISCVPKSIGQLKKLIVLHLNHNKISEFPVEIQYLHELKDLNISENTEILENLNN